MRNILAGKKSVNHGGESRRILAARLLFSVHY
jgi:hypothetical protein